MHIEIQLLRQSTLGVYMYKMQLKTLDGHKTATLNSYVIPVIHLTQI